MEQNALLSFWNELGRAFFVLKNVFEFGNQGITQFLGGANLFEFSRGVVFWISPSWKRGTPQGGKGSGEKRIKGF